MTHSLRALLLGTVLSLGLSQMASASQSTARVPFAFSAQGVALPAGNYVLQSTSVGSLVRLTNVETGKNIIFMRQPVAPGQQPKRNLLFRREGGTMVLSQVWLGGQTVGVEAPGKQLLSAR